jgi:dephospho-CoA kinase
MKVVSIVGMTGSGKSEVARFFSQKGFTTVRFGDITDEAVKAKGLPLTEENERPVRENLRKEHGMAAYAKLSLPRIDEALRTSNVVVDGLYSWEEYLVLKEKYGSQFYVVAIWSSPSDRYKRLGGRRVRPLTPPQAQSRDYAEIQNMNKGGPICMADFTILNDADMGALRKHVEQIIARLK